MTTTKSYDALNRLTSIVSTNATLTLWSADSLSAVTPMYRRGELALNNQQSAINQIVTNLAVLNNGTNADIISTNIGRAFVPRTPEAFAHDADGNLTNDARWTYTWDAENRVTSFTRPSTAPDAAKVKVECQYDSRGRRTQKVVSTWNGSAYVAQSTNRFLYDGWNLVGLFDAQSSLLQSFTWGTDFSGTMQGAGGVGGLKSMTVHSGSLAGTYFYCYDGNGNVAALVAAADGSVAAQYEYGPFGEVIRATGPLAQTNPFLFSTKFCDAETGFYYYGYRYYDPIPGRWLSRDPIGEMAALSRYAFVQNAPIGHIDVLGLYTFTQDWDAISSRKRLDGTPSLTYDSHIQKPTEYAGETKLFTFITVTKVYYTCTKCCFKDAQYDFGQILFLNPGANSTTLPHETVHLVAEYNVAQAGLQYAIDVLKNSPCKTKSSLFFLNPFNPLGWLKPGACKAAWQAEANAAAAKVLQLADQWSNAAHGWIGNDTTAMPTQGQTIAYYNWLNTQIQAAFPGSPYQQFW